MTFNFAPWAIDGARTRAGLARLASYAAGGGRSGIIQPTDLRVTALSVPGQGLRVASGGATVLNHYLSNPDEAYVVSNPSTHTVLSADMPPAQAGTAYYLVCVVVGDPEFDQTGHPFMPAGLLDPVDAPDFEYVRVVVIPCSAGTTKFEQLGVNYPGYALARLEVPGSTTTITNAMITDVRNLANSRESSAVFYAQPVPSGTLDTFDTDAYKLVYGWRPVVNVPEWATHMTVRADVSGIMHIDPYVAGNMRVVVAEVYAGPETIHEFEDGLGIEQRVAISAYWDGYVEGFAGQGIYIGPEIKRFAGAGTLQAGFDTTVMLDVRFYERPL